MQLPALEERRRRIRAILLMCGACACFSCMDASVKFLNPRIGTVEVVWARYASAFLLTLAISNPLRRPALLITRRPLLQIGRSALLLASTMLNFLALRYLRLDQALSILFSTPFFVALLSGLFFGEWAGWHRAAAIAVGFVGVLIVIRPGFSGMHPAGLLVVGGAVLYALYNISTRVLSRTEPNLTTLLYSNSLGAIALLPFLPLVWRAPDQALVIALMLLLGGFATIGHYLLFAAHRLASALVLAPFIYTQIIWATAWGYLIFGDLPDTWTIAGGAVVIASGLYMLYREHKVE
jgi:drug/metabolite transporter (DMT)-like permease